MQHVLHVIKQTPKLFKFPENFEHIIYRKLFCILIVSECFQLIRFACRAQYKEFNHELHFNLGTDLPEKLIHAFIIKCCAHIAKSHLEI